MLHNSLFVYFIFYILLFHLIFYVIFSCSRSGLPQSRGYGFVEFVHHSHALACLRELNNNPAYTKHSTTGDFMLYS